MPKGIKSTDKMFEGRRVSDATNWWITRAPSAYNYACVHNVSINKECSACKALT